MVRGAALTLLRGIWRDSVRYDYDVLGDTLYLRLVGTLGQAVYAEEQSDGDHRLLLDASDEPAGLTCRAFRQRAGGSAPAPTEADELAALCEEAAASFAAAVWAAA